MRDEKTIVEEDKLLRLEQVGQRKVQRFPCMPYAHICIASPVVGMNSHSGELKLPEFLGKVIFSLC